MTVRYTSFFPNLAERHIEVEGHRHIDIDKQVTQQQNMTIKVPKLCMRSSSRACWPLRTYVVHNVLNTIISNYITNKGKEKVNSEWMDCSFKKLPDALNQCPLNIQQNHNGCWLSTSWGSKMKLVVRKQTETARKWSQLPLNWSHASPAAQDVSIHVWGWRGGPWRERRCSPHHSSIQSSVRLHRSFLPALF